MAVFSFIQVWSKLVLFVSLLHPMHISVTEIEFDEKDKALEIMMRVFIDDLELTMRNTHNQPDLDILNLPAGQSVDEMIKAYLTTHFKVTLDNKSQVANYLGHERESDAFVFYIEVPKVKKFKTIQVMNDIITETHSDQSNLVHVTVGGKVRSMRLTKESPSDKITFDNK